MSEKRAQIDVSEGGPYDGEEEPLTEDEEAKEIIAQAQRYIDLA